MFDVTKLKINAGQPNTLEEDPIMALVWPTTTVGGWCTSSDSRAAPGKGPTKIRPSPLPTTARPPPKHDFSQLLRFDLPSFFLVSSLAIDNDYQPF
jgi:hypothetical protein